MSVDELIAIVDPPANPRHVGPIESLRRVERSLGTRLPAEFVELARTYGSGLFRSGIKIYNPFSPSYLAEIEEVCSVLRALKQDEGDAYIPFDIHPKRPGLLVWGQEWNGYLMHWLTEGEPDQWPLILATEDMEFELRNESVTTFLARLFRGETTCLRIEESWIRDNWTGSPFTPE